MGERLPLSGFVNLPGFVNAHSHTFQRRLRGRADGCDFWEWREAMLREAGRQTSEIVRAEYAETYREMRAAGYTAVGEFHYLGSDSNVRIDPLEELRELEGIARRVSGRREVFPVGELLAMGAGEGAAALGLESWPEVAVDLGHPSLRGVDPVDVPAALVSGCSGDIFA